MRLMGESAVLAFGDREYTLTELDALAGGMAATLAQRGVGPGDRVAMMSSNRPEFVIALRAIWRLGAAAVLISPAWKTTEIAHALELTRANHAVGDQPLLAEHLPMVHLDEPITPGERPGPAVAPDADALFVFSSGTTGMPKAVRHSHAGFAAAIEHWRDALGLTAADRMQIMTPPSHILGLLNIAMVLDTGAWMRLHPRFDVETMLRHIESDGITIEMAVAPIALALAAHPGLERFDLSSLRFVMWCATPVTRSVAEDITARAGIRWLTAYGTTELPVIACNPLDDTRIETVGKPVRGVRVRIADTGEIQVCSPSAMCGYLPESATGGAFDDGWYRTGDIGFLDDDGYLHVTDRAKEMVKVRGFQVAPAEVEAVLHGHPAVADCAVFGEPHDTDGEAVVAAVATCAEVSAEELIDLVGARLASYKRPRRIEFVTEIPRLPSGKVLRRVLKERHGRPSDG
ncbi:AMP-dependent synthetase [Mycolicibacterium smegmatis]|uniref:AMP-dependent synthetase and ligase n=3 Tax=Mycolicibacterium smegmatis TaxID=1772 RepID=I7FIK0_MYCS2|nr:acyl-CoA synthase [Mycolicibacterium smegmatis MC2 155]AIU16547.1 AMP-dependent synthetase [Mycolicibacterium smegmatis]AFP41200.1 AMP-dependent synthetase and ligase [Mycolicibacterium smegmatis MC2 155]AIU09922.1 AMP-dependent synthetase [Mycolicibacterium smegmatis MC2 155]AIU23170.1 AMP-dependent synthetase [Mycolicibacterium smegmatis]